MPEHTSSGAALEPFVLLANGAKGAAAVSLINQVLEAPGVYVFGELIDHPNIVDLENSHVDGPSHLRLLHIFAYGTYADYLTDKQSPSLPKLTEGMIKKVKIITIPLLAGNVLYIIVTQSNSFAQPLSFPCLHIFSFGY